MGAGLRTPTNYYTKTAAELGITIGNAIAAGNNLFTLSNVIQSIVGRSGVSVKTIVVRGKQTNAGTGVTANFNITNKRADGTSGLAAVAIAYTPAGISAHDFQLTIRNPAVAGTNNPNVSVGSPDLGTLTDSQRSDLMPCYDMDMTFYYAAGTSTLTINNLSFEVETY